MKLIKRINLIENKKVLYLLNFFSILLLIISLVTLSYLTLKSTGSESFEITGPLEIILFGLSCLLIIPIHELIHALFFKVFHPQGKVQFGFKNGMAYATSPNSYYSKFQFFIIGIAPFIFIASFLIILFMLKMISVFFFVCLASIHTAGCVGDFYWIYLLVKAPKNALIEDTEVGINFYEA